MAAINVTCPNCEQTLRVPDRFLGIRVKCKFCQQPILIEVQENAPAYDPAVETMDLPAEDNVFEQQTIGGVPPPPSHTPPPVHPVAGAGVFEQQTVAGPAPVAPRPPGAVQFIPFDVPPPASSPGGPPPLPPRPAQGPKLKVGSLIVSMVSLAVICGSVAGIIAVRRPAADADNKSAADAGQKYAVIALESSGVRFVVAPIQKTSGGYDLGTLVLENRDVPLAPRPGDKEMNPANLTQAMKVVGQFVKASKEHGVPADRLFVVCNSGVLSAFDKDAEAQGAAKEALGAGVKDAGGGDLSYIAGDDEALYGAVGCVPQEDRMNAVYLDLGKNSAKCGYHEAGGQFNPLVLPLGYVRFSAAVKNSQGKRPFAAAAEALRPGQLNANLKRSGVDRPALVNRKKYHMVGGASWALAVLTHPADMKARRVTITASDIAKFEGLVTDPAVRPDTLRAKVLGGIPQGADREYAEKEVTAVTTDRFSLDELVAVSKVLRSFSEECDFKSKEVQFFTNGLHAWPLGFLLTKSGVETVEK